jgi:3-oxoacyl-[acyl-carrier-protein] synthase II
MFIPDIAAGLISIQFGARGPNYATVSACASSAHAIGNASRYIQRGDADIMIAGGSEAAITPLCISGFAAMKAMSTRNDDPERASRPFDAHRDGFVIAEGAACLVLESLEHAQARGAEIYGEIAGYGVSGDAHHITAPAPEGAGAQIAIRTALEETGAQPSDVDYINAHGTSTPIGDLAETRAIKQVFGDYAYKLIISSTKSCAGHALGASGGMELIATIRAIANAVVPPTMNLDDPDDGCDLDYCPNVAQDRSIRVALSNSFGFGGHNACILIRRFE